jgi:hypothetical protein
VNVLFLCFKKLSLKVKEIFMKKLGILFVASLLMIGTVHAQQEELLATASGAVASQYIWRGFVLEDDTNMQPSAQVSMAGAYLGARGVFSWEGDPDAYSRHEVYVGYDWDSEPFKFTTGFTYYSFPSQEEDRSTEFWFGAKLDKVLLSPSLTAYFDTEDEDEGGGDGEYYLFSIAHAFDLADGIKLNLGVGLGYNNELFIDENGLADLAPSAELVSKVNDHLSVSLKGVYSTIIDDDVEEDMGADDGETAVLLAFHIV